jgi:hypothetical protein
MMHGISGSARAFRRAEGVTKDDPGVGLGYTG